jgi:S1-C subfamily serine protease
MHRVDHGAAVQRVVDDSPAHAAGLRGGRAEQEFAGIPFRPGGDVIVAIDGIGVETSEDLVRHVTERLQPGQRAKLTVQRGQERRVFDVVLGERPANPSEGR